MSPAGWLEVEGEPDDSAVLLRAGGDWDLANAARLSARLTELPDLGNRQVTLDLAAVGAVDTAGAWLLHRTRESLSSRGARVTVAGAPPRLEGLIGQLRKHPPAQSEPQASVPAWRKLLEDVGESTVELARGGLHYVAFLGEVVVAAARLLRHPGRLRLTSLVFHMERVGFNALPIVGLISFLIGVVLAYQGAAQLEQFGATIFVVDLIGIAVLRELGILLTAIVVAGRSGSSFTAELGSMKLNEEIDALHSLGVDPIEVVVLPRMLALVITLPLLAFFADIMGLLGGALLSWGLLDVSPRVFVERLNDAVELWTFGVGIIKAPVFAAVIGLVGCLEGLEVKGSSESLGRNTTRSVVHSIFLVIVLDALFSILFNVLGI